MEDDIQTQLLTLATELIWGFLLPCAHFPRVVVACRLTMHTWEPGCLG